MWDDLGRCGTRDGRLSHSCPTDVPFIHRDGNALDDREFRVADVRTREVMGLLVATEGVVCADGGWGCDGNVKSVPRQEATVSDAR